MKTVVITGAASGIGFACVEYFLAKNYQVAALDLKFVKLEHVNLLSLICDVTDTEAVASSAVTIQQRFVTIDAVIPSAAIYSNKNLLDLPVAELDAVIDVNIKGVVNVLKVFLPYLLESFGAIVLIASDQCTKGKPKSFAYGLTKGAVLQMQQSLLADYGDKIRINAVAPGATNTPMLKPIIDKWAQDEFAGDATKVRQIMASEHMLGRIAEPQEIAAVIGFLLSGAASYLQGVVIPVDGGVF